jgi:hypothetical protein
MAQHQPDAWLEFLVVLVRPVHGMVVVYDDGPVAANLDDGVNPRKRLKQRKNGKCQATKGGQLKSCGADERISASCDNATSATFYLLQSLTLSGR